jgi:hypothetical protein
MARIGSHGDADNPRDSCIIAPDIASIVYMLTCTTNTKRVHERPRVERRRGQVRSL